MTREATFGRNELPADVMTPLHQAVEAAVQKWEAKQSNPGAPPAAAPEAEATASPAATAVQKWEEPQSNPGAPPAAAPEAEATASPAALEAEATASPAAPEAAGHTAAPGEVPDAGPEAAASASAQAASSGQDVQVSTTILELGKIARQEMQALGLPLDPIAYAMDFATTLHRLGRRMSILGDTEHRL